MACQEHDANKIAAIIPALNAEATLPRTLACLAGAGEIIVADGGSTDATAMAARAGGARVIAARRGRGAQLAAGVAVARHDWLLLLHADTVLETGWQCAAAAFTQRGNHRCAGYFRLAFASSASAARRLERLVAWRSARGLPYGDQGLLIARDFLAALGGVRPLPLMEDVDLVRRIGRSRLVPLAATALTSAARYEAEGWTARSLRNLLCLSLYFAGVPPHRLLRLYQGRR